MKFGWTWSSLSGWWIGVDWERVKASRINPVQQGWLFRIGFAVGTLTMDKWRVLTAEEQQQIRDGGAVAGVQL